MALVVNVENMRKIFEYLCKVTTWETYTSTSKVFKFCCICDNQPFRIHSTRSTRLFSSSSSSIDTAAHCGLWPVEQCPSILSYLSPTLSIFSLPALEDLSTSLHYILGRPLCFVPSRSCMKFPFGILSSSILSRWPNQLILRPFYYIFSFIHYF
jgi:hypothetical protein